MESLVRKNGGFFLTVVCFLAKRSINFLVIIFSLTENSFRILFGVYAHIYLEFKLFYCSSKPSSTIILFVFFLFSLSQKGAKRCECGDS